MLLSVITKFVIFDFDKTIACLNIDWTGWHSGVGKIFQKYDPSFDLHLRGKPIHTLQNEMYVRFGKQLKDDVDNFVKNYELQNTKEVTPIDKVLRFIDDLSQSGKKLYIWSSNHSALLNKYLTQLGIIDKFDLVVSREMVDFIKPDSFGFTKYFKPLDEYLNSFILVGDSSFDREAANNCHIKYLDVTEI
jgi:phosphoglycolate phosphatase-like HAD superfamily hydrolase